MVLESKSDQDLWKRSLQALAVPQLSRAVVAFISGGGGMGPLNGRIQPTDYIGKMN